MTDNNELPRRVTVSQLAMAMAERSYSRVGDADVSFTRNAKGDTQVAVTVKAPMGVDADELAAHADLVYDVARALYDRANDDYAAPHA